MKELDTLQKKKIIENKIVEVITKEIGGQVTVFKPKGDKREVDLVVKKRGEYAEKPVYLQIKSQQSLDENNIFTKDIEQKSFKPEENLYLIFVYFDPIEQKLNDYIWLLPSLEFRDLSQPITSEDGEPILRFQVPIDPRKKNKYTKFFINKKDLAEILLRIIKEPGKFEFSEVGLWKIRIINLKELKKFIAEARKNTYAGYGNPVDNSRLKGSVQLEYQKVNYFYRDIYFTGEKNFIGQEIVYQDNEPIWGMVYCGSKEPKEVSGFLRKSLSALAEKCRFGEKCEFEEDVFLYQDKGEGTLKRFKGEEKIFIKGKSVYKLNYQGGLISKQPS